MASAAFDECVYMRVDMCAAALADLQPGGSFVFAKGERPDPAHPVTAMIDRAVAEGAVRRHLSGRDGEGRLMHKVVRAVPVVAPRVRAVPGAGGEQLSPKDDAVLALLLAAAEAGEPCPSNRALAQAAGLRDADAASHRLRRLRRAGLLTTWEADGHRVAVLVRHGISTATPQCMLPGTSK